MQEIAASRPEEASTAAQEAPSLVQALWRERWVVVVCVLVAGALGYGLSTLQSQRYTAQGRLILAAGGDFQPLGNNGFGNDQTRFVNDQAALITSSTVLSRTIAALDLPVGPVELMDTMTVTPVPDSNVIEIKAVAGDAETAQGIVNQTITAYRRTVKQRVDALAVQATAGATAAQTATIRSAQALYGDGVAQVELAELPRSPSSPQPVRNALVLGLIGLLAGSAYALYTQSWSRRRAGPNEASAIFGAPVLSEIPDRGRVNAQDAIATAYSEPGDAYRMAAVGLDYIRGTAPGVFLVTAPHDGAGTSMTALNLAAAAADHGRRVFLLNIEDTVRPQADADAGVLRVPLHDLAQGRIDLGHAVERRAASRAQFGIIRLQVLQPVQGHPVADVQQILDQLPDDTDLVLLDSPPLPTSSASFVLAGQVDAAVVVIDQVTTPADLEELQRRCRLAGIPVAGIVVNHVRRPGAGGGRRKRRASTNSVPPKMYDTSPRGLPLLAEPQPAPSTSAPEPAAPARMDELLRPGPRYPEPAAPVADPRRVSMPMPAEDPAAVRMQPVFGVRNAPRPLHGGAPQNGNGAANGHGARPATEAELPWSSVTRVRPGWDAEDERA